MTVMETNTVDIVAPANQDGKAELVLVDQLPWKVDEGEHLVMLQDKINTYLAYVESGQLVDDFPNAKGRNVVLKINALYAPSEKGERFLAAVRPIVGQLGIELKFDPCLSGCHPHPLNVGCTHSPE
jgi:hypothetical protein